MVSVVQGTSRSIRRNRRAETRGATQYCVVHECDSMCPNFYDQKQCTSRSYQREVYGSVQTGRFFRVTGGCRLIIDFASFLDRLNDFR